MSMINIEINDKTNLTRSYLEHNGLSLSLRGCWVSGVVRVDENSKTGYRLHLVVNEKARDCRIMATLDCNIDCKQTGDNIINEITKHPHGKTWLFS